MQMTTSEWAEFREIVDSCLAGVERASSVSARFGELMALWHEANYQASRKGEPLLPEYPVLAQLNAVEKRRFIALMEAAHPGSMPTVEWLPLDQDGAAHRIP